ncbi:MAG: cytochrome c oxidase subunit 3 family protein [Deltaproteobacteria bacterium]|nr:cytochrome c oxidase subunit 3 family protein [Deltaproteobacteria bacterium]
MTHGRAPERVPSHPDFLWISDEPGRPVTTRDNGEPLRPALAGVIPGEVGLWVFVLADMSLFALFFLVFMWEGRKAPELYAAGTKALVQPYGFANTLVLLLSSWLVVLALDAHRREKHALVVRELVGALVCAAVFVTVKAFEYSHEVHSGYVPSTDIFFTCYFVLTGIHLAHVVIGSGLLIGWITKARARRSWEPSRRYVEGTAVYWHMVDLLWVVIFTLVYLVHVP